MIIKAQSITEYILYLIALSGQAEEKSLKAQFSSKRNAENKLSILVRDKSIVRMKGKQGKIYRIAKPYGLDVIKDNKYLYNHYMAVSGNHKFRNSLPDEIRAICTARTIMIMHKLEIPVDGIRVKREIMPYKDRRWAKKNIKAEGITSLDKTLLNGDARTYFDIAGKIDKEKVYFFTSRRVKLNRDDEGRKSATLRSNPSMAIGHLFGKGISYPVYYLTGIPELRRETESLMTEHLFMVHQKVYGREETMNLADKTPDGSAVVILDDISSIRELSEKGILTDIFSEVHIVPENHFEMIKLLLGSNYRERLLGFMFEGPEILNASSRDFRIYKAHAVKDDTLYFEFFSFDLYALLRAKALSELTDMKVAGYCFHWQEEIINKVLDNKVELISVSGELESEIYERSVIA